LGQIDLSHSTFAKQGEYLVAVETGTNIYGHIEETQILDEETLAEFG